MAIWSPYHEIYKNSKPETGQASGNNGAERCFWGLVHFTQFCAFACKDFVKDGRDEKKNPRGSFPGVLSV
ncbi:MAG: hypothetical protein CVU44_08630 [Chloroflexi bacterium HGW-Chloroflexi-6]|nr:MAG: hypothetical protein CVU44_08630 [Chloroflexi bacterium HGW-Chloroflexi-6]